MNSFIENKLIKKISVLGFASHILSFLYSRYPSQFWVCSDSLIMVAAEFIINC